jgi:hypothetical protein
MHYGNGTITSGSFASYGSDNNITSQQEIYAVAQASDDYQIYLPVLHQHQVLQAENQQAQNVHSQPRASKAAMDAARKAIRQGVDYKQAAANNHITHRSDVAKLCYTAATIREPKASTEVMDAAREAINQGMSHKQTAKDKHITHPGDIENLCKLAVKKRASTANEKAITFEPQTISDADLKKPHKRQRILPPVQNTAPVVPLSFSDAWIRQTVPEIVLPSLSLFCRKFKMM